jgi:hypothetical protein
LNILKDLASMNNYEYPYQNMLLTDIEGEIWKQFPDHFFEDYFMISNKGRVKRLAYKSSRQTSKGAIAYIERPEIIMKPYLSKSYNRYTKQYTHQLCMSIQAEGRNKAFKVPYMVYQAFIDPENPEIINTKQSFIQFKDGDSLNISPENLYLVSRKEFVQKVRQEAVKVIKEEQWTPEQIKARGYIKNRTISKYNLDGAYMATYPSIQKASEATGINHSVIYSNASNLWSSTGGFYWRDGEQKQKLNFEEISRLKREHDESNKQKRKVLQYDLNGNLHAIYSSIKNAAEENKIMPSSMNFYLEGRKAIYKGYIWKMADSFEIIPEQIDINDIPVPVKETEHKKLDFSKYPVCKYPYQDMYPGNLPGEVWRGVVGIENFYMVSNLGRVKRRCHYEYKPNKTIVLKKEKILKLYSRKTGARKQNIVLSFSARIGSSQKLLSVPKAVYGSFICPKGNKKRFSISHKDSDMFNNQVENLMVRNEKPKTKQLTVKKSI